MKLTREELLAAAAEMIADRVDDVAISFLENLSDSIVEKSEDAAWEERYHELEESHAAAIAELDAEWRRKYIERFNSKVDPEEELEEIEEAADETVKTTFDDLFEVKED